MAVFTTLRGRIGLWRTTALLTLGLLWPWPIAAYLGLDSYTLTVALFFSVWTTVALLAGFVWGLIAQRIAASAAVLIGVALVPWLAGSAYLLERQRVPNAACALEVEVHIANLRLEVPRGLGIRSVRADGAPAQAWEGTYSDWPGAKPDVRALCRATDNGHAPIEVSHIWLSYRWFRRELDAVCESGADLPTPNAACAAIARTTPTVVQFYARPDGTPTPSLSHFDASAITQARTEGELEGYRCQDSTIGSVTRYCTVWFELSSKILVVSSVKLGPVQEAEDPLTDSVILVEALMRRLDPA